MMIDNDARAMAGKALSDLNTHKADNVSQAGGVHGLEVENGTWTPYVYGTTTTGTNTYSLQSASFIKIGKMVFIQAYIIMTAKDVAMAGNVLIGGLPFVAALGKTTAVAIGEYRYVSRTSDNEVTARISGGSNFMELRLGGVNAIGGLPATAINDNTVLVFSGAYEAA
jgi:hypothetical protein